MSGTSYLIAEDEKDYEIIRALLQSKRLKVKVKWSKPDRKPSGISRLPNQLEDLINDALDRKAIRDCIAVLHDFDRSNPDRRTYDAIREICTRRHDEVMLVIARDTIESWLLSDGGIYRWLGIAHENYDGEDKPKNILNRLLDEKKKMKFQGSNRAKVLSHLDGNNFSESFKRYFDYLIEAPCSEE
jgi:hypothetical protein